MTVIRPNSISGITSITAQANEINIFRSDGTLAGLQLNGVNFNNTSGISTLAALNVTGNVSIAGTLTYEDVTNIDSVGLITARSGIHVSGGNVKIGTTTAGYSTADDLTIATSGSTGITLRSGTSSEGTLYFADGTGGTAQYSGIIAYNHGDNSMRFSTNNGTERFRIVSTGEVGIGTNNPYVTGAASKHKLTVAADDVLGIGRANTDMFYVRREYEAGKYTFQTINGGNAGNFNFQPFGGEVGIGTKTPATRLHVTTSSSSAIPLTLERTHNDNVSVHYKNSTLSMYAGLAGEGLGWGVGDGADLGNQNNNHLIVTSAGNIGIGTISPTYGLDIMHDTGIMIRSSTNGVGAAISFTDASTNNWDQIGTIKYFHQNNAVVNGTNEGFIIQGTESTTAVKIQGLLKISAQPCAVVYQCTGPAGGAANADSDNQEPLHFDHVHINQGGMTISQNNGRITVPVSGIYFVSYMVSGTVTNPDDNDGIELILMVNGNEYPATNSGAEPVFNFGLTANREEFFCNNTLLVSLSKDDYVEVALDNIGSSDASINRGNFNVMLMA